jgi:recombination protein RecT
MATTNGISTISTDLAKKISSGASLERDEFKIVVNRFKSEMAQALPMHLKNNAEKYARQALNLFSHNPKLQKCSSVSILSALMTASALGLDLTPQLGQCYILPYENRKKDGNSWTTVTEAQFQLGFRGTIALAQRSGEVTRIQSEVVREKDLFRYSKGLNPILEHEESPDEDRGEITHVYAVANFKNGGYAFEVWPVSRVEAHAKKFSKSYYKDEYKSGKKTGNKIVNDKSPWYTDFESMAKKTLIMAIWKYLPVSTELMYAAATDGTVKTDIGSLREEKDVITLMPEQPDDNVPAIEAGAEENETVPAPENAAAPIDPDMLDLETPKPEPDNPEPKAPRAPVTELDKLREQLTGALRINFTDTEAEAWVESSFAKAMKDLTKDDLIAAISKINAEMDAK